MKTGRNIVLYAVLLVAVLGVMVGVRLRGRGDGGAREAAYAGSVSCRECHARFYELWAPSHHGKAMQPVTRAFVETELTAHEQPMDVAGSRFQVDIDKRRMRELGPAGGESYPMVHALGGKDIYYFLTPLERGRLQVLPLAYEVHTRAWIDTTASMVRHFADDAPLDWRDPLLTFNTACFSCHVSQLAKNYDPETDTYNTVWKEPGINCETCHGPASEHVRVCRAAPKGQPPADMKIITMGDDMTPRQRDDTCVPCHAKMWPLTTSFTPGDRYYDHYGLTTFEDRDFYPDGRDLGENYTYTLWQTSPCVKNSKLECLHCHTSSGRYRFADADKANDACLPCHAARVADAPAHTRHKAGTVANRCIACHMPMTSFGRMRRSDHSMRPPTPAATIAFGSPNACTMCHSDESPEWADKWVREWRVRDYQAPVLHRGRLVAAARKQDWARLPEMLAYVANRQSDMVFVTSLIRLLVNCGDETKWPVLRKAMSHASPLVRAAAATALRDDSARATVDALLAATRDDYRLVRVAAAGALSRYDLLTFQTADRRAVEAAFEEYKTSMTCLPDSWSGYYNIGNFHTDRGRPEEALKAYERAMKLRPDVLPPMVNAAMLYARRGNLAQGVSLLRKALMAEPDNGAANFNLALALAEQGQLTEAEACLRKALKADPRMDAAAYNLGVMLCKDRPEEGLTWCRKALELSPRDPKYAFTLAFYLDANGKTDAAVGLLEGWVQQGRATRDMVGLLGRIRGKPGRIARPTVR